MKYVVYKQPLSLDRFFVHEVTPNEASISKLDNAFVLVCLNRFQQIITVHTFQTESEQIKVIFTINHLFCVTLRLMRVFNIIKINLHSFLADLDF